MLRKMGLLPIGLYMVVMKMGRGRKLALEGGTHVTQKHK